MSALSKLIRRFGVVVCSTLILFVGRVAFSQVPEQRGLSNMSHRVKVIVWTDRQKYSPTDSMKICASLNNNEGAPIYIDRRMFWTGLGGGLKLDITDEHGNHLPARFMSDAIMPPQMAGDATTLVRLDQGFFYGTSVGLVVKDFFPKPGRYLIRVTYKSWLRKESVAPELRTLPAIWEDALPISSEPVWIDVVR